MGLSKSRRMQILLAVNGLFFFIELGVGTIDRGRVITIIIANIPPQEYGYILLLWLLIHFIWYASYQKYGQPC